MRVIIKTIIVGILLVPLGYLIGTAFGNSMAGAGVGLIIAFLSALGI